MKNMSEDEKKIFIFTMVSMIVLGFTGFILINYGSDLSYSDNRRALLLILGLIFAVGAILTLFVGTAIVIEDEKKLLIFTMVSMIVFMIIGFIFSEYGNALSYSDTRRDLFLPLGIIFLLEACLAPFVGGAIAIIRKIHVSKSRKMLPYNKRVLEFCKACKEQGLDPDNSASENENAIVSKALEWAVIDSMPEGFFEQSSKRNELKTIYKKYCDEVKESERIEKISGGRGIAKRVAMLNVIRKDLQNDVDRYRRLNNGTNAFRQQAFNQSINGKPVKESNWAVMGGAASALAGPAAGVATAVSMQLKDAAANSPQAQAQARAEGREKYNSINAASSAFSALERECLSRIKVIDEITQEAKTKKISDETSAECFAKLSFPSAPTVTISDCGSINSGFVFFALDTIQWQQNLGFAY